MRRSKLSVVATVTVAVLLLTAQSANAQLSGILGLALNLGAGLNTINFLTEGIVVTLQAAAAATVTVTGIGSPPGAICAGCTPLSFGLLGGTCGYTIASTGGAISSVQIVSTTLSILAPNPINSGAPAACLRWTGSGYQYFAASYSAATGRVTTTTAGAGTYVFAAVATQVNAGLGQAVAVCANSPQTIKFGAQVFLQLAASAANNVVCGVSSTPSAGAALIAQAGVSLGAFVSFTGLVAGSAYTSLFTYVATQAQINTCAALGVGAHVVVAYFDAAGCGCWVTPGSGLAIAGLSISQVLTGVLSVSLPIGIFCVPPVVIPPPPPVCNFTCPALPPPTCSFCTGTCPPVPPPPANCPPSYPPPLSCPPLPPPPANCPALPPPCPAPVACPPSLPPCGACPALPPPPAPCPPVPPPPAACPSCPAPALPCPPLPPACPAPVPCPPLPPPPAACPSCPAPAGPCASCPPPSLPCPACPIPPVVIPGCQGSAPTLLGSVIGFSGALGLSIGGILNAVLSGAASAAVSVGIITQAPVAVPLGCVPVSFIPAVGGGLGLSIQASSAAAVLSNVVITTPPCTSASIAAMVAAGSSPAVFVLNSSNRLWTRLAVSTFNSATGQCTFTCSHSSCANAGAQAALILVAAAGAGVPGP